MYTCIHTYDDRNCLVARIVAHRSIGCDIGQPAIGSYRHIVAS